MTRRLLLPIVLIIVGLATLHAHGQESIWIEAEHLEGVRGYCWPMGRENMRQTDGHWGLSGPGWAAEWNQGGESGFLSIATGADDDAASASKGIEIPVDGRYYVWVRYGDWREASEHFEVRIEQDDAQPWTGDFGRTAQVEEDNVMKLYWGWSFAWAAQEVDLKKGSATLTLQSSSVQKHPRQVDVIVLTTDAQYRPRIKDRPRDAAWDILESYRERVPRDLEPLARRRPDFALLQAWKLRTFNDQGFLYLWNVGFDLKQPATTWLTDDPDRVLYPYQLRDADVLKEFEQKYAGAKDVPIFSDPRIVPTFHGAGAVIFKTDPATGEVNPGGKAFVKWLEANPGRPWATMMNYAADAPIGEQGQALFAKYRDRYVGAIAGESLGYFYPPAKEMAAATADATTRRELVEAFTPITLQSNRDKYRRIYGGDLDEQPYVDVISCLSVGNIIYAPLVYDWGARVCGYESSAMTSSILGMRWAFIRGAARQHEGLTATYRSCNFGDSATMFSKAQSYTGPQNIFDNFYSVYSGAGMTWYKMDIWYQYMAGSSMFYHEQGFDEYWKPGGTTAAGLREVQLSPKGMLVDRFLRVTAEQPDRGTPYTPIAFLVDYAHGWEPAPYWPNSFKNWHQQSKRFLFGRHEKMLEAYFWTAFYPIGPESEKPMTGTNEVYLPGVFGDIFDVIFAYPDTDKWRTIDTYPVVIVAGEIELTQAEGQRLNAYVRDGGTLVVADAHLTGPGVAALALPATDAQAEAEAYTWLDDDTLHTSARFRYRPIRSTPDVRPLAVTADGETFCAAVDRGQGRLIYLSLPHGLTLTEHASPILPRLIAHLSRGLMPLEVDGDVNWLVNRTSSGWAVTLLNAAGQIKPQQGLTPTDFRENRSVTIRSHVPIAKARDLLLPDEALTVRDNTVTFEVSAGGVRIIELE